MAATFSTSYFGRYVDLYIMGVPEPSFEGRAALTFDPNVRVCTGLQKLIQIYMITILTAVGSKLLAPDDGTLVGGLVVGGIMPLSTLITHQVNIANAQAIDQILTDQGDILSEGLEPIPDDELLVTASGVEVDVVSCAEFSFTVQLDNVAGDTATFVVPLSLVP